MNKKIIISLLVIISIFAIACTEVTETDPDLIDEDLDEAEFCPEYYDPVCGVDGNTYTNECFAEIAGVEIAYEGECNSEQETDLEEIKVCTDHYDPVCGVDGNTYGNKCYAEVAGVEVAYEGECGKENALKQERICTKEYDPVCGKDGVTYGNPCEAGDMQISYEGECNSEQEKIYCTEEQRHAEVCTMDYVPVCGSDNETYSNSCFACKAGVEYYYEGEC